MSSSPASAPWSDFTQDPRTPHAAALRASDRDRDVVTGVLTEAYADGRLTREEYDERADATSAAKLLGDLPPLILDLVPQAPAATPGGPLVRATPDDLHLKAVQRWEAQRRQALIGFLFPTLICWAVWVLAGFSGSSGFDPSFPWPLFVMLGTAANVARSVLNRQGIILEEQQRLEKKQRKAVQSLEKRRQGGRPGGEPGGG